MRKLYFCKLVVNNQLDSDFKKTFNSNSNIYNLKIKIQKKNNNLRFTYSGLNIFKFLLKTSKIYSNMKLDLICYEKDSHIGEHLVFYNNSIIFEEIIDSSLSIWLINKEYITNFIFDFIKTENLDIINFNNKTRLYLIKKITNFPLQICYNILKNYKSDNLIVLEYLYKNNDKINYLLLENFDIYNWSVLNSDIIPHFKKLLFNQKY